MTAANLSARQSPREIALREPQSSKLQARVDAFFRLIDDPDGQLYGLQHVPVSSVEIVRNRPSECDTASVSFAGDAFPFDLRVIADKSMFLSAWLFEGQEPARCADGEPGQFFGVVDDVSRERYHLTGSLSCRDMTAVALSATMSEAAVQAFDVAKDASIETVVEALLRQIPGTHVWTVESYTAASKGAALPVIRPARPARGTRGKAPAGAHLSDVIDAQRLTVWSAIGNVCARAGIVPEVRFGAHGHPVVILVDSVDLQHSDVLRPFRRGGRDWRVFIDGDGILECGEKLDLADSDGRPDYVEVGSVSKAGVKVSARWPQSSGTDEAGKDTGLFQFVAGIDSERQLQDMARQGYESAAANQYKVQLTLSEPWSAGGGPHDPDLLDLGYGAAIEIATPNFERACAGRSARDVLVGRGLPPAFADRILAAQARLGAMSLLFQVAEVRHSWGSTSYRCQIGLRQFLGRESAPLIGDHSGGEPVLWSGTFGGEP